MRAILQRELLGLLRSPKAFIAQFFFLLVLSLAIWIVWPRVPGAVTLKSQIAIKFFQLGASNLIVLAALIVPIFCAPAITLERELACLEMLLATPIRPAMILLGKWLSSLLYLLFLLISSLPVMGLCFLLGGVEWRAIVDIYLIIALWLVTFSQISLLCSCYLSRTYAALTVSYLVILPVLAILIYWLTASYRGIDSFFFYHLAMVAPANVFLFLIAARKLGQIDNYNDHSQESIAVLDQILVFDRSVFPDKLLAPLAPAELPKNINPVYWKENYYELLGHGAVVLRILILLVVLISLPMAFTMFLGDQTFYALFWVSCAVLITPALGAGSFTRERENGTYQSLLITPLSFQTIFFGKMRAVFRLSLVIIGLLAVPPFIGCLVGHVDFFSLAQYIALLVALTLFLAMLSLAVSAVTISTFSAIVASYLIIFCLFVLPLLFYGLLLSIPGLSLPAFLARCGILTLFSPFAAVFKIRGLNTATTLHLWPLFYTIAAYLASNLGIALLIRLLSRVARKKC